MAWAFVQSAVQSTLSATSLTTTYTTANVQSGNKLISQIIVVPGVLGTITSVQDAALNSMTNCGEASGSASGNTDGAIYAFDVPAGDAGTKPAIKITYSQTADIAQLVQEFSGLAAGNTTALMIDGTAAAVQETPGTSQAQPAYTSTASNELLFSILSDNGNSVTWTTPSGYTADANNINGSPNNDLLVTWKNSTNGAESGTWTTSGTPTGSVLIVVAFKLPAAAAAKGGGGITVPPGHLSPMTLGLPARPAQAPQSPPSGQATPLTALTSPGRQSPSALGLGLTAPSPAPQSPPVGQATPYPLTPPGRLSPTSLGLGLTAPSPAPQTPPTGQATAYPLTPPGRQSPMGIGLSLTAPSPAPQSPPIGQATPTPLVPPGMQSPMALSAYLPPGSPAVSTVAPVVTPTGPSSVPPAPPGRLSPSALGLGLTAPSPAPQSPPAGQATSYPLTPPGMQSPMSLGVPLSAPSPAPRTPPTGQATGYPLTPPGRLSPTSLGLGLTAPSPAPQSPPAVVVVTATGPGYAPLTPPGRLAPMSLALPLTAPSPAPQTPPPPPPPPPSPIPGDQGTNSGGDRDAAVRVFRTLAPGDVPSSGAQLPRITGRAFLVPYPADAEHAVHAWPEAPPEPSAAEQIITAVGEVLEQAAAASSRIVEAGRIFADPPYERKPKTCGALRKVGGTVLACKRKPGHPGKHSDRGLDWR